MLKLVERHLHWLPYLTIALLIAAEVRLNDDAAAEGWGEAITDRGLVLLLVGLGLLSAQLALCVRRDTRVKATATLVAGIVLVAGLLTVLELMLPPIYPYPAWQRALQDQITRRDSREVTVYRDVELVQEANELGWIDRARDLSAETRRVVFIGDSFLEMVSTRPLALRVEDRLSASGHEIEVVNLAKSDTDPQTDYRMRLNELAAEYRPEHVFVFLYAGNDLNRSFRHTPYEPTPFRVTDEAIRTVEDAGLDDAVVRRLETLAAEGRLLETYSALAETLGSSVTRPEDRMLVYMACVAHTRPTGPGLARRLWPDTVRRIVLARDRISDGLKQIRRSLRSRDSGCARRPSKELHEQYQSIVDLPKDQRLDAIAEVVAGPYCGADDATSFRAKLDELPASFRERIVEERSPGLLLDALPRAVAGETIEDDVDLAEVERTAREYTLLMEEFRDTARELGAELTVVLIPVAGYGDPGYRRFWAPLIDTDAKYRRRRAIHEATSARLDGAVPVIDLLDHAPRLTDGYWKFDGHWNERGNDAVAEILTEYITEQP